MPPTPYLQHGGGARGKFVEGFDSLQAHKVESVHVSNEAAERKVSTGRASGFRESGDRGPRIPAERNRNAAGAASPRGRSAPPRVPRRSWRHRRFLPWLIIHTAEFSAKPQGGQTDPVVAWPLVPCGIGTCRPRGPLSHPLAEHPAWRGRRGARRGDVASSRSCLPLKRREGQATGRGQAASWCDGRGPGSGARPAGERGPSGVLGSVITAWEGRRCLRDLLYPMPQCTTGDRSGHLMVTLETRSPGG